MTVKDVHISEIMVKKMVKINPYLMVKNGKEAIELYKDLFEAKVVEQMPFQKEAGAFFGFTEDFD